MNARPYAPALAAALLLAPACGDSGAGESTSATGQVTTATSSSTTPTSTGVTSDPGTGTGTGTTAGTSDPTDASTSDASTSMATTGSIFDVGAPDLDPVETTGDASCTYVDILFVIDNSPSMGPYQEQLAFAFPTFVDAMWENLPVGTDLHVGMTTTSFFTGSCSETTMNCKTAQTLQEILDHYTPPTEGSTNVNGEQGRLFEWAGMHYYAATVGADPWPLKIWFSDAAIEAGEVGCSYEMMSAGAGYAVHPANAATNAGFLRDAGAVLVIFFLTDEPDKSPEGPQAYYDMITTAKAACGGAECVIAAGLIEPCIMGVGGDPLWEFLSLFPEPPEVGSIDDAAGYSDVIGGALAEIIGQKCDEIGPPE